MSLQLFLSGIVVFLTHALEAVTGFGCTVLAFPFVTFLLDIKQAKIILSILAWILALYFVITKFKNINFKQYLIIVGFAVLGMPFGILFFNKLNPEILKACLGVFIIITSVIQLVKIYAKSNKSHLPEWAYYVILFFGGIIHGAFASGGPFVVLYATKKLTDKGQFRATLCLLWTTLNTILFVTDPTFRGLFSSVQNVISGHNALSSQIQLTNLLWMFPFLIVGIIIGEVIHNKVNAELFKKIVFFVLFITGVFMLIAPFLAK